AAAPLRRVAAGQADQLLLDAPLDLDLVGSGRLWPMVEGRLEAFADETLADPADRRQADGEHRCDFLIGFFRAGGIGKQKDAGMGELARRGLADADQPFQARSLLAGQGNLVLGHDGTPLPEARTSPELQAKQFPATYQSKSADLLARSATLAEEAQLSASSHVRRSVISDH